MIGQLTNHLWQSTFFALAAALLTLVFRGNRAKVRYSLWLTASLKFLVPFSILIGLGSQLHWTSAAKQIEARAPSPAVLFTIEEMTQPFAADAPTAPPSTQPRRGWIPVALTAGWFCGFVSIGFLRWRAWRGVRDAVGRSVPLDLALPVQVRLSAGLLEPGVVGLRRPILLLPEGVLERLSPSEFDAVIAHELCHVRRRDNIFASIQMLVEALFWFHPLVWWIGARLVAERERACDEDVVSLGNRPDVYADAILSVCKLYVESPVVCVSGVTGADIRSRIEAIMSDRGVTGLNLAKKAVLVCAGVAAVVGPVSLGVLIAIGHVPPVLALPIPRPAIEQPAPVVQQEPAKPPAKSAAAEPAAKPAPKFDAVSIRPCTPGEPGRGRGGVGPAGIGPAPALAGYFSLSPGRLNVSCGSIMTMIGFAYVGPGGGQLLNDSGSPMHAMERIKGLPEWTVAPRYTIEAATEDPVANGPTDARDSEARRLIYGPMFQSLLEDRFKVKLHRETEEVPMYALTVAKGGLKIKPSTDADCIMPEPGPNGGFVMKRIGPDDKPYCRWMGGEPRGPNRTILGGGVPLNRLASFLSDLVMDRHVIDKTGITDTFNIHVEFSPDERTPCTLPGPICQVDPNSDIPAAPSIFTALEQQLGLKLEPVKGPHEYLKVDHVERPTEN